MTYTMTKTLFILGALIAFALNAAGVYYYVEHGMRPVAFASFVFALGSLRLAVFLLKEAPSGA